MQSVMFLKIKQMYFSIRFDLDMNCNGWYFELIRFELTQFEEKTLSRLLVALKRAVFVKKKCEDCPFSAQSLIFEALCEFFERPDMSFTLVPRWCRWVTCIPICRSFIPLKENRGWRKKLTKPYPSRRWG